PYATQRKVRAFGACLILLLQFLIAFTGNYAFFNLLTMALCVLLFDDAAIVPWLRGKLRGCLSLGDTKAATKTRKYLHVGLACFLIVLSLGHIARTALPPIAVLNAFIEPYGISNGYGLFAVMTTERDEIIIEGSNDRVTWLPYEFPFKPGDLN